MTFTKVYNMSLGPFASAHPSASRAGAPQLSSLRGLLGLTGAAAPRTGTLSGPLSAALRSSSSAANNLTSKGRPDPTALLQHADGGDAEADEFAALVAQWIGEGDFTSPTMPPQRRQVNTCEYTRQALLTLTGKPRRPPPISRAAMQLLVARRVRPSTARAWAEVEFERPAKKKRAMSVRAEDAGGDGEFDFLGGLEFDDCAPFGAELPSFDSIALMCDGTQFGL